jgi:putative methyltransferase (TIGR04325 family)
MLQGQFSYKSFKEDLLYIKMNLKKIKSRLIYFINFILYINIKFTGSFSNWKLAKKKSYGYNHHVIINKKKESFIKVLKGEAKYERDTFLFYKDNPDKELISIISKIKGKINICDFGGSFASTYFQNIKFLNSGRITWNVIEQKKIVKIAKKLVKIKGLKFYDNINKVYKKRIDLIIFSSVLQYLEFPFKLLDTVVKKNIKNILVLRTPFHDGSDIIKIQEVPNYIYNSSYPVRIFSKKRFLEYMKKNNFFLAKKLFCDEVVGKFFYKSFYFKKTNVY